MKNRVLHWVVPEHEAPYENDLDEAGWSRFFEYLRLQGYDVEMSTSADAEEGELWFEGSSEPGDEELIFRLLEEAWHHANEG